MDAFSEGPVAANQNRDDASTSQSSPSSGATFHGSHHHTPSTSSASSALSDTTLGTMPPLQIDDDEGFEEPSTDEDDVTYIDGYSTRTKSVSSSIYHYQYENGRRYHAYREGEYVLPNDEQEQDRLDLQHHIWRLMLGGALYTAPLPKPVSQGGGSDAPLRILDLGTGTGIWAIDMADEFPNASVVGVDLSPIQPDWVPPNCAFYVDDYEGPWTYREDEKFDYIHGRALSGTCADWPKFYRDVFANLKPGAWLEMQEYDNWVYSDDGSIDRAPWTREWVEQLDVASRSFGKQMNCAKNHRDLMIAAGFESVEEKIHRVPIGPWAKDATLKEIGRWERTHMQMSVESYSLALFSRVLGYSNNQIKVLVEGVKRELRSKDLHLITTYRFITGRKPASN